ncbi:magnesium chelatase family protein [Marinospirillum celere]|uniref:Magnesium chelatase family protein n=1 Tax=Marinospirillum celere TaxID=1122252 RepID=A0A1I1IAC7_9GAMM|nr:YifB family Mg chelatase-like AAA ATPase [Marinospirillum celere]SFC32742.1 magnesium chelatase family protein [Marinospirillum celere]
MSLALIKSRALLGLAAPEVRVEVHLANGLPAFNLVGLPETAVKESRDRVRSALLTAGFEFPSRRITVNLSPADLPKEGGRYDLPIALGILVASGQVPATQVDNFEFVGELALNGELRAVKGILPTALAVAQKKGKLLLPADNAAEAALVSQLEVRAASHLLDVSGYLLGQVPLPLAEAGSLAPEVHTGPDLADIKGQAAAKRALEIAAAGGHNLLFKGPPGSGKTLLASCLPGLLPALDEEEALQVAAIDSITRGFDPGRWRQRPFRSPHHSSSAVALVGGGSNPRPGEISLAHQGVLFLDELPEFARQVLEVLREPLESGEIHLARAARRATYPARFQLVAAMNPCPCGHLGNSEQSCSCSPGQIQRYQGRLSGPLLDRIDLHLEVPVLPPEELWKPSQGESSQQVRARVVQARQRQKQRAGKLNAHLSAAELEAGVPLDSELQQLLSQAMTKMKLSARAAHRVLKVALTLADLEEHKLSRHHLLEAMGYRQFL